MEEKKVPALRFRGFDNAWEQRRLGQLAYFTKGVGYSKSDLREKGVPIILYGRLYTKYEIVITEVDTFVEAKPMSVYSRGGEVIVPASGETAEDISIAAVVEKSGILLGGDLNIITVSKAIDSKFLAISISNGKPHNEMAKMAQGKSVVHLHNSDLEKIDLVYPKQSEQKRMSTYFCKLDHLISLHQRKLEMLKKVKKSMLEKMFPKNDAKVPELRFSDFTDAWEHCKLGDVFEQTSNLVTLGNGEVKLWSLTVEDGLTPKTERYNREFLVKKDDKFKEVRPGDIVYNPMNMTLGAVGYNGMTRSVAVSGYYTTMIARENYDAYYINTWLKSSQAIKLYKIYATGSLIEKQRVQFPTLSIISASFPRDEEQKQIGEYFRNLDHLISLHQRKLEKLKNIKKSMLEKMFII